jgi:hypothetical protein
MLQPYGTYKLIFQDLTPSPFIYVSMLPWFYPVSDSHFIYAPCAFHMLPSSMRGAHFLRVLLNTAGIGFIILKYIHTF